LIATQPSLLRDWGSATAARLADGRLHLQHGPIDLIVEAFAEDTAEVEAAYRQAIGRFDDVLEALVTELAVLRLALGSTPPPVRGPVARRMVAACWPHRATYVTPMAAVAGAVADEVLAALVAGRSLSRAYVNNGGDIALHLADAQCFRVGLAGIEDARLHGIADVRAGHPVRGVATSGWRGRSQSLGIADAVTVLARDAAAADAAATLVANAVNVDHPGIRRERARALRDDSDLGDLPVTVAVPPLPPDAVVNALNRGVVEARRMQARGLVHAAVLRLQGTVAIVAAADATDGEHS
jgi:ApbE superfamily uncharacterized protein (UPF0280 family)